MSVVIMKQEDGTSKGFGFVCFRDWHDAQQALDRFGNSAAERPDGQPSAGQLYVTEAKTKEQR